MSNTIDSMTPEQIRELQDSVLLLTAFFFTGDGLQLAVLQHVCERANSPKNFSVKERIAAEHALIILRAPAGPDNPLYPTSTTSLRILPEESINGFAGWSTLRALAFFRQLFDMSVDDMDSVVLLLNKLRRLIFRKSNGTESFAPKFLAAFRVVKVTCPDVQFVGTQVKAIASPYGTKEAPGPAICAVFAGAKQEAYVFIPKEISATEICLHITTVPVARPELTAPFPLAAMGSAITTFDVPADLLALNGEYLFPTQTDRVSLEEAVSKLYSGNRRAADFDALLAQHARDVATAAEKAAHVIGGSLADANNYYQSYSWAVRLAHIAIHGLQVDGQHDVPPAVIESADLPVGADLRLALIDYFHLLVCTDGATSGMFEIIEDGTKDIPTLESDLYFRNVRLDESAAAARLAITKKQKLIFSVWPEDVIWLHRLFAIEGSEIDTASAAYFARFFAQRTAWLQADGEQDRPAGDKHECLIAAMLDALLSDQAGGLPEAVGRASKAFWARYVAAYAASQPGQAAHAVLSLPESGDTPRLFASRLAAVSHSLALVPDKELDRFSSWLVQRVPAAVAAPSVAGLRAMSATHAPAAAYYGDWARHHIGAPIALGDTTTAAVAESVARKLIERRSFDTRSIDAVLDDMDGDENFSPQAKHWLKTDLRTFEALQPLAREAGTALAMLRAGLQSAAQVVAFGRGRLSNTLAQAKRPNADAEASQVFNRARARKQFQMQAVGQLAAARSAQQLAVFRGCGQGPAALDAAVPDWRTLFGSQDACECKPSESIIGQGAYLVDILEFLRHRAIEPVDVARQCSSRQLNTALEILLARRPDLVHIDFTEANAMTELPYVDLLCELLEDRIMDRDGTLKHTTIRAGQRLCEIGDAAREVILALAPISPAARFRAVNDPRTGEPVCPPVLMLRDAGLVLRLSEQHGKPCHWHVQRLRQTTLSMRELAAEPEYSNPAVYTELGVHAYGYALPFSLGETLLHAYLKLVDTNRGALRIALELAVTRDLQWAVDALSMELALARAIVEPNRRRSEQFFGLAPGAVLTAPSAAALLPRFDLQFTHLNALCKSATFGRQRGMKLELDGGECARPDPCDTQQITLRWGDDEQPVTDGSTAELLVRFVRLRRHLDWQVEQLDRALSAERVGKGQLDAAFLTQLAGIAQLAAGPFDGVDATLALFCDLSGALEPDAANSAYRQVFLVSPASGLDPEYDSDTLKLLRAIPRGGVTWSAMRAAPHHGALASCLGLTPAELTNLTDVWLTASSKSDIVTVPQLSKLYAVARLRETLSISWEELDALADLYGNLSAGRGLLDSPLDLVDALALDSEIRAMEGLTPVLLGFYLFNCIPGTPNPAIESAIIKDDQVWRCLAAVGVAGRSVPSALTGEQVITLRGAGARFADIAFAPLAELSASIERDRALGEKLPRAEQIRSTRDRAGELLEGPFTEEQRAWDSIEQQREIPRLVDQLLAPEGGILDLMRWAMDDAAFELPDALRSSLIGYIEASLQADDVAREQSGVVFATIFATPFMQRRNRDVRRTALTAALAEACEIGVPRAAVLIDSLHQADESGTAHSVAALFMGADLHAPSWPSPQEQPAPGFPATPALAAAAAAVRHVGKVARFVEAPRLDDDMIRWMSTDGAAGKLGWTDLDSISADQAGPATLERWRQLAAASRVAARYPAVRSATHAAQAVSVCTVFARALDVNAAPPGKRVQALAALTGAVTRLTAFPADLVEGLLERALDGLGKGASAQWALWLDRLGPAIDTLRRSGLSVEQAAQATGTGSCGGAATKLDQDAELGIAMMVRKIVKKRFKLDAWITAVSSAQGSIRERKRDALLAYLIGTGQFADADAVFEHLLVDPQMGACMPASRLVQAHGTVQMFIQRCLMGLEPQVAIPKGEREDWAPWSWMKDYRVWEANRKIFLFPENWIEPELRDDKSEFYTEFENALNQNVLEQPNIERAVIQYLHKVNEVAKLDICASYYQFDDRDPVLHVVGRTTGEPHAYFYRTWVGERRWTPWERIDLDIEGDHLLLYMRNGRMHLAWPVFTEQGYKKLVKDVPQHPDDWKKVQPESQWHIRLAVSELSQSQWLPRKLTSSYLHWPARPAMDLAINNPPQRIRLAVHELVHAEILVSDCTGEGTLTDSVIGSFALDTCSGAPEALEAVLPEGVQPAAAPFMPQSGTTHDWFPSFARAKFEANRYAESGDRSDDMLVLIAGPRAFNRPTVLTRTPGTFTIQVPQQGSPIDLLFALLRLFVSRDDQAKIPASIGAGLPFAYADRSVSALFAYHFDFTDGAADGEPVSLSLQLAKAIGKAIEVLELPAVRTSIRAAHEGDTLAMATLRGMFGQEACRNVVALLLKIAGAKGRSAVDREAPQAQEVPQAHEVPEAQEVPEAPQAQEAQPLPTLRTGPITIKAVSRLAHPLACELVKEAYRGGMDRLYDRPLQLRSLYELASSVPTLDPAFRRTEPCRDEASGAARKRNAWEQAAGFESWDAAAGYNWEIFFHMPFHVAVKLAGEGKFKEAIDWFHYIFNPVGVRGEVAGAGPEMANYWMTKPFFEHQQDDYDMQRIQFLTDPGRWLAELEEAPSGSPEALKLRSVMEQFAESIIEWRNRPSVPHQVARYRWVAFQKTVVMRYVDTLLQWGDAEFRRFEMESVFRAAQLYVLAGRLLGQRPRADVKASPREPQCYEQMEAAIRRPDRALDKLAEAILPPAVQDGVAPENYQFNLYSDHFCVPQNDKLVELWDRVADRLFKIRHCQDIAGIKRKLSLYAPPIDPAMLVRATAAGLSIDQILADLAAPLPHYRFSFMHQKATEFAHEVKALGSELLSAIERKDGDELTQLRSRLDITYARAALGMRRDQIKEAERQLEGIDKAIDTAAYRKGWYEGRVKDGLSAREKDALKLTEVSMGLRIAGQALQLSGGALCSIPTWVLGTAGAGGTPVMTSETGGSNWASALGYLSNAMSMVADYTQTQAGVTSVQASYDRREQEWSLQKDLAEREIAQLEKQRVAAEIRIEIVRAELENQELQIEHLQTGDEFIRNKFSNAKLYDWMVRQITATYYKTYQLAVDLGMKAERCMEHELPPVDGSAVPARYINAGYWDGMRKGLLSGNGLMHDLKRMEVGYMERNVREFEITKHISLAAIDPLQLLQLRATGTCALKLSEALFDLDYPGHYRRRIKSVSLSLPCIAGPYTSVACQLTLLRSHYRPKANSKAEDSVFDPVQVTSIATSSGQNDSGMFELNFRDERYLPFEGAGAVSEWRLELPPVALRQFDYAGISDAILHIRYTSRDGGEQRRKDVSSGLVKELKLMQQDASHKGVWSMVSLRNELPDLFAVLRSAGQAKVALDQRFLSGLAGVVAGQKKIAPNGVIFAMLPSPESQHAPVLEWQVGSGARTRVDFQPAGALLLSKRMGGAGGTPEESGLGADFFKEGGVVLHTDGQQSGAMHDVLVLLNFSSE